MYYYVVMLFSTRYVLVAMVVRMECMVCKHTFIRLGNYKRHLAKVILKLRNRYPIKRYTTTTTTTQQQQTTNKQTNDYINKVIQPMRLQPTTN